MRPTTPLSPEVLYTACDAVDLDFSSTDALPDIDAAQVHTRAVEAIHLGLDIHHDG